MKTRQLVEELLTEAVTVQVVQLKGGKHGGFELKASGPDELARAFEERGIRVTGTEQGTQLRPELRGWPRIDGFTGPMYNGPGKIRYEDWEAYNFYST